MISLGSTGNNQFPLFPVLSLPL